MRLDFLVIKKIPQKQRQKQDVSRKIAVHGKQTSFYHQITSNPAIAKKLLYPLVLK